MALYLDANAVVKRYIDEKGSDTVRELMAHPESWGGLFSCEHVEAEVLSAFAKKRRKKVISKRQHRGIVKEFYQVYPEIFGVVGVNTSLIEEAVNIVGRILTNAVGGCDAIHIAAAKRAASSLDEGGEMAFITSDRGPYRGAEKEGLVAFDPAKEDLRKLGTQLEIFDED